MIAQRTLALISYNDSNKEPQNQDSVLASQLANYLRNNGIEAEVKGYSISALNTDTYQWLILIPSLGIDASSQISKVVDTAIDQVIKRRMKGVLAITTGTSDLPPKWATIRKYDASDPNEANAAFQSILRAMKYPKITYTAAVAADQRAALTSSSQSKSRHRWLKPVPLIAILVMLLVVAGGFTWFVIGSNSRTGLSPSNLTATAQARTYTRATQTALAKTLTPSSSPTVDPTQQAMQNEYSNIMKSKPTIVGFQASEQWSTTADKTCTFDNPDTYHAVIKTKKQYTRCMAANTKFKNFALQVTMNINGDAGGVIFRDNSNGTYYRFAFNQSDPNALTYSIYLCNSDCTTDAVGTGAPLASDPVNVDQTKPITLTIIAKDDNIDLYINKTFLKHINDRTSLSGQIGVFAASLGTDTDVTFSNLKVWSLDT